MAETTVPGLGDLLVGEDKSWLDELEISTDVGDANFVLDEDDGSGDGDNSLLEATGGAGLPDAPVLLAAALSASRKKRRLVPFVRVIKAGTVGLDVRALKRALSHAGYLTWKDNFTSTMGKTAVAALHRYQRDHHDPATGHKLKIGPYDKRTHRSLARFYDPRGIWLLHQTSTKPTPSDRRLKMRGAAILTWQNAWAVHYTQGPMRMEGVRYRLHPPHFGHHEDCSSEATWLAFVAGVPDPNSLHYNGLGFTGTISAACKRVSHPKIGTFALYGPPFPYTHVATVIGFRDGHPIVQSHGGESGPKILPYDYRGDFAHWADPLGGR